MGQSDPGAGVSQAPVGTSLCWAPFSPEPLLSAPAHWPCVPAGIKGLLSHWVRGNKQKVYPDQVGTPEELPFPMILIHPLLHSLD